MKGGVFTDREREVQLAKKIPPKGETESVSVKQK